MAELSAIGMLIIISGFLGYLFNPLIRVVGFIPGFLRNLLGTIISPALTFILILAPQVFPNYFGNTYLALSMLTLTIMYIVVNEVVTYEELTLLYLPRNLSIVIKALLLYIFQSNTNIHLIDILKLLANIAKHDFNKYLVVKDGKVIIAGNI